MLRGERTQLVPIETEHLEAARQWVNDPVVAEGVLRCLPVHRRDQERWYEAAVDRDDRIVLAIDLDDGTHVGTTGFYHIDWLHRRCEFWIIIGSAEHRGQGLGGEVTDLMLAYAFESLNLNKVCVHVDSRNAAALATYRAAGFKEEGLLAQEYYIRGTYRDVHRLAVLRHQYDQKGT